MSKPKLYLFAIGGTGSRVLSSLAMLLATGVKVNAEKIIPMIIDTDINNGDVEKCRNIIRNYNEIHKAAYRGVNDDENLGHFFRTEILPPKELNISGNDYGTLKEMVSYETLNSQGFGKTKGLFDLCYSDENKNMPLEKGFLGNPNVGSVVLKNVVESKIFKEFTQDFGPTDRIFVISSIFGGTGAAGFPLLLNVFRDENTPLNNGSYINNAIIGGVSVLPYFQVDVEKFNNGESAINSSTFLTKTKAALSYYDRNLKNLVNTLYFVGDTSQSNYENFDGGIDQKNPSNIVEIIAASAVLDFLDFESKASTVEELTNKQNYFEFGINTDTGKVDLNQLKNDELRKKILEFHYFSAYVSDFMDASLKDDHLAWKNELNLPNNYHNDHFFKNLKKFTTQHYYRWLHENASDNHNRKFYPFDLSIIMNGEEISKDNQGNVEVRTQIDNKKLFTLVNGISAKDSSNIFKKDKINFNEEFSKIAKNIVSQQHGNSERATMTMFNIGTQIIVEERFVL